MVFLANFNEKISLSLGGSTLFCFSSFFDMKPPLALHGDAKLVSSRFRSILHKN